MKEVFKRFTVTRKQKNEKELEDVEIDFTQTKKKRRNEDTELFAASLVVATTAISLHKNRNVMMMNSRMN